MGPGQDYDRRTEAHDAAGVRGSPNSELMLDRNYVCEIQDGFIMAPSKS